MRGRRAGIAAFLAALWAPTVASAAEGDGRAYAPPALAYDWTVTLGAEGREEPLFQGSSRERLRPYPIFAVRRYGAPEPFRGPRDGLDVAVIDEGKFQIGPVGQFVYSQREQAASMAVRSLGNVPWAAEVGIFAQYWWVPWLRTRTEVRQGFHGHHGIVSDITTDAVVPVGPQLTLSAGPRLTLATTPALTPYFNITPAQSLRSGLPIYDTKGGIRSYGAGAQARYLWTPQWATHVFVEYERLSGEPADSPLVTQKGSPDQVTIGFGVTRSFDIKTPW
jgi:outer membrane protein